MEEEKVGVLHKFIEGDGRVFSALFREGDLEKVGVREEDLDEVGVCRSLRKLRA